MGRDLGFIVAVDGPSGAGKSTVCREVSRRTAFALLDTGAIYRSLAWFARGRAVSWEDETALVGLCAQMPLRFEPGAEGQRVWVGEHDVSEAIRTAELSRAASVVSAHPGVRSALLPLQRRLGRSRNSIVEGRDIGTVVFPDAELKVFFTASVQARARRRRDELLRRGETVELEQVEADILDRDRRDATRDVAPMRQAEDAVLLDTSEMDFDAACAALEGLIHSRLGD
ncbi:MAG: (d)CMP kinase [Myxococcota bacterium]|jgi:cytidylate kinase|nr:(d)CMP kinase [Myxococcota bacterium]